MIPSSSSSKSSEKLYFCPGENHPISRSVHLSRLAAFYPKCRNCPLRTDTGHLPPQTVQRLQRTEQRVERPSLWTGEGIRGVYLNELTRRRAGRIAANFAEWLWQQAPVRRSPTPNAPYGNQRSRPFVVVGYDERPSSPDLFTGVVASLRRMGCQVIDIGLASKPCFSFAVAHLDAAAGVYVSGAGRPPSWNGLDFALRGGRPVCDGSRLETSPDESSTTRRPSRTAGTWQTFRASVPYEAGLWKHFHALRPLVVCCGCPVRQVRETLRRIFAELPCQLHEVNVPFRTRDLNRDDDPDCRRLSQAVCRQKAHLGVLIDDDGQSCVLFDENGQRIAGEDLTRLLAEALLSDHPEAGIVLASESLAALKPAIDHVEGTCFDGGSTLEEMFEAISRHHAVAAGGTENRFWVHDTFPTCDAVLTLARVLQALSRSDTPFSQVAASGVSVGRQPGL